MNIILRVKCKIIEIPTILQLWRDERVFIELYHQISLLKLFILSSWKDPLIVRIIFGAKCKSCRCNAVLQFCCDEKIFIKLFIVKSFVSSSHENSLGVDIVFGCKTCLGKVVTSLKTHDVRSVDQNEIEKIFVLET